MAVIQSTYTNRHVALSLGQIRNTELHNVVSRLQQDATAVGFARAMFAGTTDDEVTATPSANFEGISIRKESLEQRDGGLSDVYEQRETIPLLTMGVVAVQAAVAVNKGQPAYVTPAGAWTNVVAGNTAIAGAKFDQTIAAAGLVALRVK